MTILDWLSRIFGADQAVSKAIESLRADMKLRFDALDKRQADLAANQATLTAKVATLDNNTVENLGRVVVGLEDLAKLDAILSSKQDSALLKLDDIRGLLGPGEATTLTFEVSLDGGATSFEPEEGKMQAKVTDTVRATVVARDEFGNVTKLDPSEVPTWTPTGDLTITPADDGLSAIINAKGTASTGNLAQVTGDADTGPGVRPIVGTLTVDWLPGDAVTVDLQAEIVPAAVPA